MMKTKALVVALAVGATVALSAAAQAGDAESCKTVRFAEVGWTDIQLTTNVASILLEGMGYAPTISTLSVPVSFASMKNKDIDAFLGNWMPSMTADIKPYLDDKSVEQLSVNLENAGYGLVVPQYVADAGVKSLADIGAQKDKFGGKIYGIEAGNDGNRIIQSMIDDAKNNLAGFTMVESSEAGMITEAEKAIKDNQWIVFLGWTPHPVLGKMAIHYLDGMGDSGFGAATVYTNVRAGYGTECPNAAKLISNLKFDIAGESAMMDEVIAKGADPKVVAKNWLKANADTVKAYLNGVTAFDGSDPAAGVAAAIGG
ncbi:MAG: choline ABC transporter substrate-binding protein [Hyphomicrobiaceae bacterium]